MDYTLIAPEELLAICLQTRDELAWVEFVRRFHPLIARVALRVARQWGEPSPQIVDDLVQETYLKLCAGRLNVLQTFKSAHKDAIYGYVKVFTANLVHDHFKVVRSQKRGGWARPDSVDRQPSGDLPLAVNSAPAMLERNVLIQQINTCLAIVASGPEFERDRRIFWLYYRVGLSANAIAALPSIGLSTKGVESTILRLTRAVRQKLVPPERTDPSTSKTVEGISPAESL